MNIVMVHGIWDTGAIYRRMAEHLSQEGHVCYHPDMTPANGSYGLNDLSEKLRAGIDQKFGDDPPLAVIGFSMGSLVARNYLQTLGGARRTTHFFSISGPHQGTLTAHLWRGKASRDMRFGSDFLSKLNSNLAAFENIKAHSYRTPYDLLIVPSKSSHLDWAENHKVHAAFHHRMVVQTKIFDHITQVLAQAAPGTP